MNVGVPVTYLNAETGPLSGPHSMENTSTCLTQ
jgi:hypothetical protein